MSKDYESMYARHRNAAGMTQERAAELLGVAPRTLQAWERGESTPPNARVLAMCDIYTAPTLAIEHLRMCDIIAYDVLPPVKAVPVAQAVVRLQETQLQRVAVQSKRLPRTPMVPRLSQKLLPRKTAHL